MLVVFCREIYNLGVCLQESFSKRNNFSVIGQVILHNRVTDLHNMKAIHDLEQHDFDIISLATSTLFISFHFSGKNFGVELDIWQPVLNNQRWMYNCADGKFNPEFEMRLPFER